MDFTVETHRMDFGQAGAAVCPQPVAISIENLTKCYRETLAVDRLSLDVPARRLLFFQELEKKTCHDAA